MWLDEPYNIKSDIWSVGCVVYESTMFRPPFISESMSELAKMVLDGIYEPIPSMYSKDLNIVLAWMLQTDV